jgi:hypothetical protein
VIQEYDLKEVNKLYYYPINSPTPYSEGKRTYAKIEAKVLPNKIACLYDLRVTAAFIL